MKTESHAANLATANKKDCSVLLKMGRLCGDRRVRLFFEKPLFLKNDLEFYVRDTNGMSIRPESRARVKCARTI
ncbi:MAG: hypothetical protein WA858_01125, partial [Xanthobacteraceae bacterium]